MIYANRASCWCRCNWGASPISHCNRTSYNCGIMDGALPMDLTKVNSYGLAKFMHYIMFGCQGCNTPRNLSSLWFVVQNLHPLSPEDIGSRTYMECSWLLECLNPVAKWITVDWIKWHSVWLRLPKHRATFVTTVPLTTFWGVSLRVGYRRQKDFNCSKTWPRTACHTGLSIVKSSSY